MILVSEAQSGPSGTRPSTNATIASEAQGIELQIAKETQKTGWYVILHSLSPLPLLTSSAPFPAADTRRTPLYRKINTSPSTIDDKEILKKLLTTPPVKKIDLHFPLGLEVTARNLKGVTIKDALDAIHKQFKKRVCLVQPFVFSFPSQQR